MGNRRGCEPAGCGSTSRCRFRGRCREATRRRYGSGHPDSCVGVLVADLVAQPRGQLIIFAGDRVAQPGPKAEPLALVGAPPGNFAHVPRGAVGPAEERKKSVGEDAVVVRAAEPAPGTELHELEAAVGTGQAGELADELA